MSKMLKAVHDSLTKVAYAPVYATISGSVAAGVLLSQIVYWNLPTGSGASKLKVEVDGRPCLAKSREEMCEETGLGEWQRRAAMETLEALGFISTEVHLFQGKVTTHIFFHAEKVLAALADPPKKVPRKGKTPKPISMESTRSNGGNHKMHIVVSSKTSLQRLPSETTDRDYLASGLRPSATTQIFSEDSNSQQGKPSLLAVGKSPGVGQIPTAQAITTQQVAPIQGVEPMASASEVLKALAAKQAGKQTGDLGVMGLASLWTRKVGEKKGEFQKALTGKDKGQLKLLQKALGEKTGPALEFAVTHWGRFAFEAGQAKGLKHTPDDPVIGFVLQYHDVLVRLMDKPVVQLVAEPKKAMEGGKSVSAPIGNGQASKQLAPEKPVTSGDAPVSKEEFLAAWAKVKASKAKGE